MHIPLFTCAKAIGEPYLRSVSIGLSKLFTEHHKSHTELSHQVLLYLNQACSGQLANEDYNQIYKQIILGLAKRHVSVYALSYKHRMWDGPLGCLQKQPEHEMAIMAAEIAQHALAAQTPTFCFWLDQFLRQRHHDRTRRWIDNSILPYAVFDTIVFDYTAADKGMWLHLEKLLASGRSATSARLTHSTVLKRGRNEGGPDSLLRAASAVAGGDVDHLRASMEDKQGVVNWAIEMLDFSQFHGRGGGMIEHFTRPGSYMYYSPWDREKVSSVMVNLELLPGELCRSRSERGLGRWEQEAELFSSLIPADMRGCCDGSWLSKGQTRVYATKFEDRFVYLQILNRVARDQLLIAAIVSRAENCEANYIESFMAAAFDHLSNDAAQLIVDRRQDRIEWSPIQTFLKENGIDNVFMMKVFHIYTYIYIYLFLFYHCCTSMLVTARSDSGQVAVDREESGSLIQSLQFRIQQQQLQIRENTAMHIYSHVDTYDTSKLSPVNRKSTETQNSTNLIIIPCDHTCITPISPHLHLPPCPPSSRPSPSLSAPPHPFFAPTNALSHAFSPPTAAPQSMQPTSQPRRHRPRTPATVSQPLNARVLLYPYVRLLRYVPCLRSINRSLLVRMSILFLTMKDAPSYCLRIQQSIQTISPSNRAARYIVNRRRHSARRVVVPRWSAI